MAAKENINFKLIAVKLGEELKDQYSVDQIERIGHAVFDFHRKDHPMKNITSIRSQRVYDWVMTLSEQAASDDVKLNLLNQFVENLTAGTDFLRRFAISPKRNKFDSVWPLIHPKIISLARKKFEDGWYADSVETALKEINIRTKKYAKSKTGKELDGASLMTHVFSLSNPIVVLDDLNTDTGRDTQVGYMQIFAGSMTGIRNPKAHEIITISPERAIHLLFLASLLMYKLDEGQVP